MIFRNANYAYIVKRIKEEHCRVIIYGAGMIGQIVVPYFVQEHHIFDNIDCYIDMDERKKGKHIKIGNYSYEIRTPDYLHQKFENVILLITNSKFFSVVKSLEQISELDNVEGYIIPLLQIQELEKSELIKIERMTTEPMIPKVLHYCWFGGKQMPEFLQNCIGTWREKCPDYQIIEWNEKNYDVNRHRFTKEAYENKKYGFVSDVARLDILYENGGIYLDTDVTLEKNIDDFLFQKGFIGVEKWGNINTGGGCGFIKYHPFLKKMIDYRNQFSFLMEDGSLNTETNGLYETIPFLEAGFKPNNSLQVVKDVTVYPSYVNHPYDYMSCETNKKESTVSVHHFFGGWMDKEDKTNRDNTQKQYQSFIKRMKL